MLTPELMLAWASGLLCAPIVLRAGLMAAYIFERRCD